MGRPRTPPLLPIFRSEAQARVLATLLLADESLHVRALSDRTRLPYSVVQREVERLERARLLKSTRFAASRSVRANESHPLYPELRALLLKSYGPREILGRLLAGEQDIEAAFLFGSWAERYEGVWGAPPADIDVLLVGSPAAARVEELEAEAEDTIGRPVQVTVVAPQHWRRPTGGFLRTIKRKPLVPIPLERS